MTRRSGVLVAIAAVSTAALGAAAGGASATLPPDDTAGTGFVREQAEAAAAAHFASSDPTVTDVACVPPSEDSVGAEMLCYGRNESGQVVTATATINDHGGIEMSPAGSGPTPTTPAPAAPSPVIAAYSGSGGAARPVDPITAPTIVRVTHDGTGEFSVQPQHGGVAVGEPLLTTTGRADGRYLVGLGGTISAFTVTADGAWTLELHRIGSALSLAPGAPVSGSTPDVISFATADTPVTVEYTGDGPITIRAVTGGGVTSLVDEAAGFSGDVTLPAGPGQLLVDAVGAWSLTLPAPAPTTPAPTTAAPTSDAPATAAAPTSAAATSASATTTAATPATSVP